MGPSALELQVVPTGRNGNVTITALIGGNPLVVNKIDLAKEKDRGAFAQDLCEQCSGIDRTDLDRQLLQLAAQHAQQKQPAPVTAADKAQKNTAERLAEMPQAVRDEAEAMLADPKLFERVIGDVQTLGVAGEKDLIATTYLCGTSRLLERPLSQIVQGPSSSGKSYTVEKAVSCFPSEAVMVATQITPQALFYMEPESLKHKFVIVGERSRLENDDTAEGTRALREMLSAGRLSKLVTMKVDGRMQSVLIEQEGPIAYVESTTLMQLFNEDANRSILITTDERPEQTRRILRGIAQAYSGAMTAPDKQRIIDRHHALQRMLEPYEIVVPYAEQLAELFHTERVEARRAFPQLLGMIQASALLHQRQRPQDGDGRIVAGIDDYAIARHLLHKPFARQLGGGISDGAKRLYDRIRSWNDETFTTTEAVRQERNENSDRSVRGWISELHEAGAVELVEPNKGPKPAIWKRLHIELDDGGGSILPKAESILSE